MDKSEEVDTPTSCQQASSQAEEALKSSETRSRKTKKNKLRIALWGSGSIWLLSWIGIALEIFYWHHMTPSLRLNPPPQIPSLPPPRPGSFLLTVICSSVIAPPVCLIFALITWIRKSHPKRNLSQNV